MMKHRVPRGSIRGRMPAWSAEELELLQSLAGDMPFQLLVSTFRQQAKIHRWPLRSADALQCRARLLGLNLRHVAGTWVTTGSIGEMLGVSLYCVNHWFRRHPLERRCTGNACYYKRSDVRRWARKHPEYLGGIAVDRLFMLLEDRKLAEWIVENYPHRPPSRWETNRVRCIETGRVYASQGEAARAHWVTPGAIHHAMAEGYAVDGKYHFEVAS